MSRSWEDVLDAYVEGVASRADAESLLMRIDLSDEERDEVERALRTADLTAAALEGARPPEGMEARLRQALRATAAPASLPQGWAASADGFRAAPGQSRPTGPGLPDARAASADDGESDGGDDDDGK